MRGVSPTVFLGSHLASQWSNFESFIWYTWHLRSGTPILRWLYVMWQLHILIGCWLYYYGTHTPRSDSKAIHKFRKFITCISFYYIQHVINPQRQRWYMLDYRSFTTKHSSKVNFFLTQQIRKRWNELQLNHSSALEMLALNQKWFSGKGQLLSISRPTQDWSSRLKWPMSGRILW